MLALIRCRIILNAQSAARQFNTGISPSELTALYMEPVIISFGAGIISLVLIFAFWRLFLYWAGESYGENHHRQALMCWSMFSLPLLAAVVASVIVLAHFPESYLPPFFLFTR